MRIDQVVLNASPFILLCKSDLIDLLPRLFTTIFMPEAVAAEILDGNDMASTQLRELENSWLLPCSIAPLDEVLVWNLGDGETEVLSFALKNAPQFTALLDDRAARKCAKTLGIKTLGTAGILVLAKKRKLLKEVLPELEKLRRAGFWVSDEVLEAILRQAGEAPDGPRRATP